MLSFAENKEIRLAKKSHMTFLDAMIGQMTVKHCYATRKICYKTGFWLGLRPTKH